MTGIGVPLPTMYMYMVEVEGTLGYAQSSTVHALTVQLYMQLGSMR